MRKILLTILAVTVLLGTTHKAVAQQMKPVVVVSVAGYNELESDIDVLARLGDDSKSIENIKMMLQLMTGGKWLAGLDNARPAGGVFLADKNGKSAFYVFIPVTNLDQLAEFFSSIPQLKIAKQGNVYEIDGLSRKLYAKQIKKWAILSDAIDNLKLAPADPEKLLGDLPKRYNLAVKFFSKNLPQVYREQILAQLSAGLMLHDITIGVGDDEFSLQTLMSKYGIRNIHQILQEMDEVVLGWEVDASNQSTYVDLELTAKKGTKLSKRFATLKSGQTKFAGFFTPEAAIAANFVGELSDLEAAQWRADLAALHQRMVKGLEDEGLSAEELKSAESILRDVMKVLNDTVKAKKIDGGVALTLRPKNSVGLVGVAVSNGKLLNKVIEKWLEDVKETDPLTAKLVKLNAETYQGIDFHILALPVDDPDLKAMVGDKMEYVVGIADDRLYMAYGGEAIGQLKAAMDRSKAEANKEVPPLRTSISVKNIVEFAASGNDPDFQSWASLILPALADAGDKDHLLLTATPIERGVRVRLEVEQGLLEAIMKTMFRSVMIGMPPGAAPQK